MSKSAGTDVDLYPIAEVCRRLGVTRSTVYRLIQGGHLRTVDVAATGSRARMRVRSDDLARFIESRTVEAPAADDVLAASS